MSEWQQSLPEQPDPIMIDGEMQFKIDQIMWQVGDRCLVQLQCLNGTHGQHVTDGWAEKGDVCPSQHIPIPGIIYVEG